MMRLLLSDRALAPHFNEGSKNRFIDLSALRISNCTGCFGCWIKTPGKCVIHDDAASVYVAFAQSDEVVLVSHVKYGSYDTVMKTMLERTIPTQQAFIRICKGETHHVQRNVFMKKATVIAYGQLDPAEKEVFTQLVHRNAHNMSFESVTILFTTEDCLDEVVGREVSKWQD